MAWKERTPRSVGLGARGERMKLLVVTLAAPRGTEVLQLADQVNGLGDVVEVRLDYFPPEDDALVWRELALPAIATCRPEREGGKCQGDEDARLRRLREAARRGALWVDVEWDAAHRLEDVPARRIVSRHLFDGTPADLRGLWEEVASQGGDVVKVATMAHTLTDALRVCALYTEVDRPTVAIAMGEPGVVSRLLALAFPTAFLTYAAPNAARAAAPGQVPARAMVEDYAVDRLRQGAAYYGYLDPHAARSKRVAEINRRWREQGLPAVLVPLPLTPEDDLEDVLSLAWRLGFRGVWLTPEVGTAVDARLAREGGWIYPDGSVEIAPLVAPQNLVGSKR